MKKTKYLICGLIIGLLLTTGVFASNEQIQARFAEFKLSVNGEQQTLNTKPLIHNGTSYLPVREVADLLGYDVDFDDETKTIILNNNTNDYNSTLLEDDPFDDWTYIRETMEKYDIQIGIGNQAMVITKNGIDITFPLDKIKGDKIYELMSTDNNMQISILVKEGRLYLSPSELIELEIID